MREVEIDNQLFRIAPLPTRTQLYVVKRLMPVLQGLTPLFALARQTADDNAATVNINVYDALAALTNTIGMLSDGDADFILDNALHCVAWRQGSQWLPLRAPGGVFMLGAADRLDVQLRLLWEVLQESLSDFSVALLLPSQTAANGLDQPPLATPTVARPTMASSP